MKVDFEEKKWRARSVNIPWIRPFLMFLSILMMMMKEGESEEESKGCYKGRNQGPETFYGFLFQWKHKKESRIKAMN